MRVQHYLLILAGIMLFGAGGLLARVGATPAPTPVASAPSTAPIEVPSRAALSAKIDLPAGHFLQPGDFDWADLPINTLRPEYIIRGTDNPDQFLGAVLLREVKPGETLRRNDMVSPRERGFLAAVLPPGRRSISIAVDEVSGGAGLIFPGDRVDVIVTHSFSDDDSDGPDEKVVGQIVLGDARVLAVDQAMKGPTDAAPGGDREAPAPRATARTVTLEVSPREAEKLAVAVTLGRVCLALRGLKRSDESETTPRDSEPVWAGDVLGVLRNRKSAPPPLPPIPTASDPVDRPRGGGVVVLRGGASGGT